MFQRDIDLLPQTIQNTFALKLDAQSGYPAVCTRAISFGVTERQQDLVSEALVFYGRRKKIRIKKEQHRKGGHAQAQFKSQAKT